jgi:YbbR domain-containing protein
MIAFLRHLVVDDFLLKLFSLVLALLFWFTVSFAIQQKEVLPAPVPTATTELRTFSGLPVVIVAAAADVRNFKVSPNQIEVTVQGDARSVQSLQSKDIRAIVDLTGFEPAHPRKSIEISTPTGVACVGVHPQEVQVIIPSKTPVR